MEDVIHGRIVGHRRSVEGMVDLRLVTCPGDRILDQQRDRGDDQNGGGEFDETICVHD